MSKVELVISRLHFSKETEGIQDQLKAMEIGESIEYNGKVYKKTFIDLCEVESTEKKVYSSEYSDYDFNEKNIVGYYVRKVNISANDIDTVITNSFEGGSNYWLGLDTQNEESVWKEKPKGLPYSTWATQMLLEGKTLHFYDIEDEEEKFTLTLEQLVNGFKLNAEQRSWDCDLDNGDATTSDCILQYGIFGKVVYG